VRVRAIRRPLKTRLEKFSWALDSPPRRLYGRISRTQGSNLRAVNVVHSHRTQSADGTQMKTGRTTRLSPRVPALTIRF
jgi:hypothetical protein